MKTLTGLTKHVLDMNGLPVVETWKPKLNAEGKPTLINGQLEMEPDRIATPASLIANSLARTVCATPIQAIDLGLKLIALNGAGRIAVEDADYRMMLEAVDGDQAMTNLAKAAALKILQAATDVEENRAQRRAKGKAKGK